VCAEYAGINVPHWTAIPELILATDSPRSINACSTQRGILPFWNFNDKLAILARPGVSYHVPMRSFLVLAIATALTLPSAAQDVRNSKLTDVAALPQALNFEDQQAVAAPAGWTGNPEGTVFADDKIVHGGHWAARLERKADASGAFSTLHRAIAMDFAGKTIELRGFLRTEAVSDFTGLWLREDGESSGLAFDNMRARQLKGTTDWTEYSITLPVHPDARQLFFGVLLVGSGKVWVDDLQLLVDGKPIPDAPKLERQKTVLELDNKFDEGSGVSLDSLSKAQIENLATLGQVWGFLKYHHPRVLSGKLHWDYELFRILPAILQAQDHAAANAAMLKWIAGLGTVAPCHPCAGLDEKDLHLRPDVSWLEDEAVLGTDLSKSLRAIYANRPVDATQFYVALAPNVKNPSFQHELSYSSIKFPDNGFQLLALYRFWNIIQYWSPNRNVLGEDWGKVLAEFIPRIALAKTSDEYKRELMALIARAHDTHANLWSSLDVRPPTGACQFPVTLRFVENRAVVTRFILPEAAKDSGLALGDVITEIDGVPVKKLVETWTPYYAASNDAARFRDIGGSMTRGKCGESSARVLRGNEDLALKPKRVAIPSNAQGRTHDLPGETFRLLSKDVAYLKLSSVKAADAAHYVEAATGTKALIIDIRNYPSEFMVFALGSLLVGDETQFVRFTVGDLSTPGAFHWTPPLSLKPEKPHYTGRVMILVDEVSLSQAEYTTMAFRASPKAMVVGSTTAGADGNVSPFALPGGLSTMISGIGVFYPDKKPTQRIGILPDVEVRPTIAGVRSGRDEVLEEALRQVLGSTVSPEEIQKMAKPAAGN
jgi:C-terminal processing protease CtpA/Prc